jgi:hypothetical protein
MSDKFHNLVFHHNKLEHRRMIGIRWLFVVCIYLASSSVCLGRTTYFFELDNESFQYDPPVGYCRIVDEDFVRNHKVLAAFILCDQNKALLSWDLNKITAWIWLSIPEDPKSRNYNMTRKQYIRESTTFLSTVTMGTESHTYYGDRQVPDDFKRPTPWILPAESDEYGVYQPGFYFVQEEEGKVIRADTQVTAFTLIRGKVFEIRYSEEDPNRTKDDIMLKRLRVSTKKFVMDNLDRNKKNP